MNIETEPEIIQRLEKIGQMGVSQSEVNGRWIVGYYPNNDLSAWAKSGGYEF